MLFGIFGNNLRNCRAPFSIISMCLCIDVQMIPLKLLHTSFPNRLRSPCVEAELTLTSPWLHAATATMLLSSTELIVRNPVYTAKN